MKSFYSLFLLLFFFKGYTQDFSGMISIELSKKCKTHTSVDKNQSNAVLFFLDNKINKAFLLDGNTTFIDSLSSKSSNYEKIIADNTLNKVSKIVFANQNLSSFLIERFDFNLKNISRKNFSFDSNEKKIIQVFFNNNAFHILSYSTLNKNLILTSVSDDEIVAEESIKIESNDPKVFERLVDYSYSTEKNMFPITIIEEEEFSPFSQTQSISKGYLKNNIFVIGLEINKFETNLFSININDKTATSSSIKKDVLENAISWNSIVIENNLYEVEQNKDNFTLQIKDFQGNVIKKIIETDMLKSKFFTEVELGRIEEIDSKKYFKKVDSKKIAINYKNKNGILYVNIGSVTNAKMPANDEQSTSYTQIGALTGGLIGGLIGAIIDSATTSSNMSNTSEMVTKGQTFCQIAFKENFEVIEFTKKDFSYNKLKKQIINSSSYSIPSIFYMNQTYYLGYYKEKEKRYFFKKFKD